MTARPEHLRSPAAAHRAPALSPPLAGVGATGAPKFFRTANGGAVMARPSHLEYHRTDGRTKPWCFTPQGKEKETTYENHQR